MDTQRARQIAESPETAHVTYREMPVYIQHVDESSGMARIYPLDEPENEQTVPVRMLVEQ